MAHHLTKEQDRAQSGHPAPQATQELAGNRVSASFPPTGAHSHIRGLGLDDALEPRQVELRGVGWEAWELPSEDTQGPGDCGPVMLS